MAKYTKLDTYDYRIIYAGYKLVSIELNDLSAGDVVSITGELVANNNLVYVDSHHVKIKDFRSLKANTIARKIIDKKKGPAITEKKFKKWQLMVADYVAKKLGNTRNVALNDYIDPSLWNKWRKPEWGPFIPKKLKISDD